MRIILLVRLLCLYLYLQLYLYFHIHSSLRPCPFGFFYIPKFPSFQGCITHSFVNQLGFLVQRDSSFVNLEIQVNEIVLAKFRNRSFTTCFCTGLIQWIRHSACLNLYERTTHMEDTTHHANNFGQTWEYRTSISYISEWSQQQTCKNRTQIQLVMCTWKLGNLDVKKKRMDRPLEHLLWLGGQMWFLDPGV